MSATRPRFSPLQVLATLVALGLLAHLAACTSGSQLRQERREIASEVERLHEAALRCDAEREIALAESHLDFLGYAMQRGFYSAALRHLEISRTNIQAVANIVDGRDECFGIEVVQPAPDPCTPENLEVDCRHPNCAGHPECGPCTAHNPEIDCTHPNCQDREECLPCGSHTDLVDCDHPNCAQDDRCAPCGSHNPDEVDCDHPFCLDDPRCEPCTEHNPEVDCDHPNCADHDECTLVVEEEPMLVVVTQDRIEINEAINFELNRATITGSGSFAVLNDVVRVLERNPSIHLRIEGHTDSTGRRAHNMQLSDDRANSVRTYLIQQGISPARLTSVGFGPDRPVATNDTREGRALNRRVEFHITQR